MNNFNHLHVLIFSSHKTSSQTLHCTIKFNRFNSKYMHSIEPTMSKAQFIQNLINYKHTNKKKIQIISIVRNPKTRLLSSFFQTHHCDEIDFLKKEKGNTTIDTHNCEELSKLYTDLINNKQLNGKNESIDELADVFLFNIQDLQKKQGHYYLNHELFELYVLNFDELIKPTALIYLNAIFKTKMNYLNKSNLSIKKSYYNKYITVKQIIGTSLNDIIEKQYHSFYFTAFN
jgi:hypothetical protein